jgi:hypothetical protein
MGRKRDIAGLAALAGLGLMMANRDKKGGVSESQIRVDRDASEMPDNSDGITDDMRKRAFDEGNKVSEGERVSRYKPNPFDVEDARTPDMPTVKPGGGLAASAAPAATGFKKNPGAVSPSPGNQRGPRAEELAAYEANRNVNYGNESRRTPMGSTPAAKPSLNIPEMQQKASKALADDPLALAGPATGLGVAGYRAYKYGKSAYDAAKASKAAGEAVAKGREAVTNPLSWMAGPKNAGKFSGEVPAAGRESVTNPMSWLSGPKNADKFKEAAPSAMDKAKIAAEKFADRFRKKPMSEADTTGGAIGYKRGGKAKGYASGGSVSSASSRGDGIATKGKTRGKIC